MKKLLLLLALGLFSLGTVSAQQHSLDLVGWMFNAPQYSYKFVFRVWGTIDDPQNGYFTPERVDPVPRVYRMHRDAPGQETEIFGVVYNCEAYIVNKKALSLPREMFFNHSFDFHVEGGYYHADGNVMIPRIL